MSSQHYEELGRAVRDRRRELDLTQLQIAERGGPSDTKISQIETGKPQAISPATLRKLDVGLDWWPGSARWILAKGEQPTSPPQVGDRLRVDVFHGEVVVNVEEALAQATPEQLAAELLRRTGRITPTQQARREADAAGEDDQDTEGNEPV